MAQFEEYVARSVKPGAAAGGVAGPAAAAGFGITVRFLGGLNEPQKTAFKRAADRWARVIIGDLPPVNVDGEQVDDVLILAQGSAIDGPGKILGQAGPTHLRPTNAGAAALLPAKGIMSFDIADLERMEAQQTLGDVITHEMGHVIGVGTLWAMKALLQGAGTTNPRFTGARAMAEYGRLQGGGPREVPVENTGGSGTADAHWRESLFRHELMSGFIAGADNPISKVTVASLADLGYTVDLAAAEPYQLPDLVALAEAGTLTPHVAPVDFGVMLPNIPQVLPDSSLR